MKLEFMEEFSGSSDQMIVKGKRTKRPRPSSSTSSTGGGGDFCNSLVSSPTTSTTTQEDEDMAHCLILLARGYSPPIPEKITTAAEDKFTSRKFSEIATTTTTAAGKVGIYVYECKTCNRTFPSFQALGGHRASHKRPKTTADDDRKKSPPLTPPPSAAAEDELRPPPSTHSVHRICHNDPNKAKIHECAICGSEFGSGQALGGHMRRHRVAASSTTTRIDSETTSSHEKPRNMLALDLNLPAPPEDQFPAKQQPRLVFSAAALVDCHY